MSNKRLKRLQIQQDRLREFEHQVSDCYEERKIGNEWWVKNYNGGTGRWQVSVYSNESFRRYKSWSERRNDFEYSINKD